MVGAAVLLAIVVPSARALPDLGEEWIAVRSGRVVAISSLSAHDTYRITERVREFQRDVFGPGRPFRVADRDTVKLFLFEDEQLYRAYAPDNGGACYQPGDGVDYLLLKKQGWEDSLPLALSEEALHRLDDASPGMPVWLGHGLAVFYSTYRSEGDHAEVGHRIDREFAILRHGNPIPWDQVPGIDESSAEVHEPDRLAMFDAQAWILAHYLVTETGKGERGVADFVARLDTGEDRDAAFEAVFHFPRAELSERGKRYSRSRGFDAIRFPRPREGGNDDDPDAVQAPVSRQRLLVELGEMVASLRSGSDGALTEERLRLSEEHLDAALTLDPSSAAAERGLGLLRLRLGDVAGALAHLRRATERDPADLRAHALLAEALLQPFEGRRVRFSVRDGEPPAAIAEAREHLKACLSLDPDQGSALILLARTYLQDPGDPTPGIRTLQKILSIYPGRHEVVGTLVLLLLKAGEPEATFSFLDPGSADDPRRRSLRHTAIGEALRVARTAWQDGDLERANDLVAAVRDRRERWMMTAEQAKALASFEGMPAAAADPDAAAAALSPEEAERQYGEYRRALQLCADKKYKKAVGVLDDLLARPNDPALHESIVTLHEQASYNRALSLYERGEYAEALELARTVKKGTPHDSIASLARALIVNCRRALER